MCIVCKINVFICFICSPMRTTEGIVRSLQMKNLSDLEIKTLTCKPSHVLWYIVIF